MTGGINLVPIAFRDRCSHFRDRCSHCGGKWKRIDLSRATRTELEIGKLRVIRCEKCLGVIAFACLPQEDKHEVEAEAAD